MSPIFFMVDVDDRLKKPSPQSIVTGAPFVGMIAFALDTVEIIQVDEVEGHTRVLVAFKNNSREAITMRTKTLRDVVNAQLRAATRGEVWLQ